MPSGAPTEKDLVTETPSQADSATTSRSESPTTTSFRGSSALTSSSTILVIRPTFTFSLQPIPASVEYDPDINNLFSATDAFFRTLTEEKYDTLLQDFEYETRGMSYNAPTGMLYLMPTITVTLDGSSPATSRQLAQFVVKREILNAYLRDAVKPSGPALANARRVVAKVVGSGDSRAGRALLEEGDSGALV